MEQVYIRLLSFYDANKLIEFVKQLNNESYANITSGGVSLLYKTEEDFEKIETFLKSLNVQFQIGTRHPGLVNQEIAQMFKTL